MGFLEFGFLQLNVRTMRSERKVAKDRRRMRKVNMGMEIRRLRRLRELRE
jgi:hypothetical protein